MSLARSIIDQAPTPLGDSSREATSPRQGIREIIAREALGGVPEGVDLTPWLEYFERTYGPDLAAVILYGSVLSPTLRAATSTPDFIVVTDHGKVRSHSRATRLLHGVLPPTSRSAAIVSSGQKTVFKYLHLDRSQLATTTGPRLDDLFVAGRLSKSVRLLLARDAAAREMVLDALVASVTQLAPRVCALLPPVFDLERYVLDSLALSYRGEWRIEAPDKVERLARAAWGYYAELYRAVLDGQIIRGRVIPLPGERFAPSTSARDRRSALRMLRRTRWRAMLRWPKYAITVPHAGELVAGKLERAHPDMHIGPFARRHPILFALPVLVWLLLRGALRSRGPEALDHAPRPRTPSPPRPVARVTPRVALIANLAARGPRRRGFHADAYARILGDGAVIRSVGTWDDLRDAVAEVSSQGVDVIAVLGGDGTLGGVVSELVARCPGELPVLVPLSGGGFNLTARSLGATRSPWRDVRRLAAHLRGGPPLHERVVPVLRVEDPEHADRTRHGFMFGTGVVYEYSRYIATHGGTGFWNSVRHTLGLTLGSFVGTRDAVATWRPVPAALSLDHSAMPHAAFTAVCACAVVGRSSVVKLLPEPRPPASGTFVYLASALTREEVLRRRLVGVLRGTFRSNEHRTGHATTLRLASSCGYLLDGELVAPGDRSRELVVTAGPAVRFWVPRPGRAPREPSAGGG